MKSQAQKNIDGVNISFINEISSFEILIWNIHGTLWFQVNQDVKFLQNLDVMQRHFYSITHEKSGQNLVRPTISE